MGNTFGAGIPTSLDVEKLMTRFGVPDPGDVLPYGEIEHEIKQERGSYRWGSVISAWRKKLEREYNIILEAVPNKGYKALDGAGRVDLAGRTYKGGLRRVTRAATVAVKTDRSTLTDEQKRVVDHIQDAGAKLRMLAAQEARKIKWAEEK